MSDTSMVGVNDLVFENTEAYFNSSNTILIKLTDEIAGERIKASLLNLLGKQLNTMFIEDRTSLMTISNLNKGLYLLVLDNNKGATRTFKLLKK